MASNLNEILNKLRLQKVGCDVVFQIGDHQFPAHRKVLLARMEYFRNMPTQSSTKKKTPTIELDTEIIDSTYFSDFLNYVYTSKIDITIKNLRAIYQTADYFRFHELIDKVKEHMKSNMEGENVGHFRTITQELGIAFSNVFTQSNLQQSMNNISSGDESISTLSFKHLKKVLETMKESGKLEEMFHYSIDWILEDEVNRSGMLLELLKNIPLDSLSFDFLKQAAYHYELIKEDDECLKLLFDAFITASKSDIKEERRQRTDSLYTIGGLDGVVLSSVSRYHHSARKWTATTPMPTPRTHFGCAVIGHKIYVCGGNRDEKRLMDELTVFDTYYQKWTQLTPMKHARQLCAAAALNGQIYVAGGWNVDDHLAVVERYNVQIDEWSDVAPMTTKRQSPELVELNGFLYAIGGHDGNGALNSVERYDPQTDQWTTMNNTNNKYNGFGSAVLNNNIYIADGYTCEVYSRVGDKWTEMPTPSECNSGRRLAAYNGKLYAIGGEEIDKSKNWKGLIFVEVFDHQAQVWRPETDMNIGRCFHGAAVIKRPFLASIKVALDANENLNELRLQNTGCDIVLEIGAHKFPAHRKLLIAGIKHFWNILSVQTETENKSTISLDPESIEPTFFGEILNYIYTSKITLTTENIRPIYRTAEYFRFDELIYEVVEHMEFTVNIDNVRSYMSIAIELGLKSLQGVFTQVISQQIFSDINRRSRERLIHAMLFEDLEELLQNLKKSERIEDMFLYSIDWIVQDEVKRSKRLLELLKNIQLQKLSSDFLIEVVSQTNMIRKDSKCLKLLLNAVITVSSSHTQSHKDVLYAIGGKDGEQLSSVSEHNSTTREWTATTPMPSKRSHFGCAVIGSKIYVGGGHNGQRNMNELTVFDTYTRKWAQLPPMKHVRQECGVAALNEQIYVAGGWNDTDYLAVVERYNVRTDEWSDVAPMATKRSGPELVALNGFLYAIGGHDGSEYWLNIVERYDPQTDKWTRMNNTNNNYNLFGSAVMNGNIYITDGCKCEVYNAAFKRWLVMSSPSQCDDGGQLAVFNGKLYGIGGRVGEPKDWKSIKTVEVYDFEERIWKPEPDMNVARCFHCVAVVN